MLAGRKIKMVLVIAHKYFGDVDEACFLSQKQKQKEEHLKPYFNMHTPLKGFISAPVQKFYSRALTTCSSVFIPYTSVVSDAVPLKIICATISPPPIVGEIMEYIVSGH
jgi:hypothetical protein